ncbi:IGF-like family receptor 1 [Emydura macquarii macquarii]|uniref:IGF-like family receptor 1 n=1 Tax=Emydura macquarii macquarii TaxID=1129001 RepID=UPI00352ACCD8
MLLYLLLCLLPGARPFSSRCGRLQYWHQGAQACVPCEIGYAHHVPLLGREFTENCGMRDQGGRFASPSQECPSGTFNDGRFLRCQPCSACPPGAQLAPCTPLHDAHCCAPGQRQGPDGRCQTRCCFPAEQCHAAVRAALDCTSPATTLSGASLGSPTSLLPAEVLKSSSYTPGSAPTSIPGTPQHPGGHGPPSETAGCVGYITLLPLVVLMLVAGTLVLVWMRCSQRPCQACGLMAKHRLLPPPLSTEEATSLAAPPAGCVAHPLCLLHRPGGAPLQRLLDDADLLEQLIMLLDPEGKAGGGTRHLAARYGLSATWIDYAYSLRSTRSPLRATLETVAARQPDATLGELAGLLAAMGRKDALQVLEGVQLGASSHSPQL